MSKKIEVQEWLVVLMAFFAGCFFLVADIAIWGVR